MNDDEFSLEGYKFLGKGSTRGAGWLRDHDIYYMCVKCKDMMWSQHDDYFECKCGAMYLDIDGARFGSNFGDDAVLLYRKIQK